MNRIVYRNDLKISVKEFIDLLTRSTLDKPRPVNEPDRIKKMLEHGNILITAWSGNVLVGVSRAMSHFSFCCYLADLAVDEVYQRQGIGKRLIEETHKVSGENTSLILLAAPAAVEYYPKIGMERSMDCFMIRRKSK